jgi:uncharacterized protein YndB with AHSA1/START domain
MGKPRLRRELTSSLTIKASCEAILGAFFDPDALARWWHITRAVCVPRPLGCYALEWKPTENRDETLGRLGGVFHGTVMTFDPHHEFFVANAYWMAPDGEPLGPMAFEVTCSAGDAGSVVHVRQSSAEASPRTDRYYGVLTEGLSVSLPRLKTMLESVTN